MVDDAVDRLLGSLTEHDLAEDDPARVKGDTWFEKRWAAANVEDNANYSKIEKDVLCEMENHVHGSVTAVADK